MKIWQLIFLFSLFTGNLFAETVTWDFDKADEKNISGFIIYRSQERLANGKQINYFEADQKADKFVIWNRKARQAEITDNGMPYGFYFYYVIPFKKKAKGNDFDEQIRYYSSVDSSFAPVKIETQGNAIFLSWESIPGIEKYRIDVLKKAKKGWKKSELTTRNCSTWLITEPGEWIFKVFPVTDYDIEIFETKKLKVK